MGTINQFKNVMTQGGARSNQFSVMLKFPDFAAGSTSSNNDTNGASSAASKAQFLCNAASLPASELADATVFYRGRQVSFAGERTFRPWTITLYNDTDLSIRSVFENWVNYTSQSDATYGELSSSKYQTVLDVNQLDRNDNITMTYQFYDAFPINVGEINLSWDENNRIQVYNVTFQYNYWLRSPVPAATYKAVTAV